MYILLKETSTAQNTKKSEKKSTIHHDVHTNIYRAKYQKQKQKILLYIHTTYTTQVVSARTHAPRSAPPRGPLSAWGPPPRLPSSYRRYY